MKRKSFPGSKWRQFASIPPYVVWPCVHYWHCPHAMRSKVFFCNGRPMVSVFLSQHGPSSKRAAGCLLLWAQRARHINRSLQQRRAAGECGQCHVVSARKIAEHRRFLLLCQSARRPPPVGKRSIAIYMSICGCRASGRARIS